jgi:hypothetical protein
MRESGNDYLTTRIAWTTMPYEGYTGVVQPWGRKLIDSILFDYIPYYAWDNRGLAPMSGGLRTAGPTDCSAPARTLACPVLPNGDVRFPRAALSPLVQGGGPWLRPFDAGARGRVRNCRNAFPDLDRHRCGAGGSGEFGVLLSVANL